LVGGVQPQEGERQEAKHDYGTIENNGGEILLLTKAIFVVRGCHTPNFDQFNCFCLYFKILFVFQ